MLGVWRLTCKDLGMASWELLTEVVVRSRKDKVETSCGGNKDETQWKCV